MDWKTRLSGTVLAAAWRATGWRITGWRTTLALNVLLMAGILGAILVRPTYGRWEIPAVISPTETPSHSSAGETNPVDPTRTPTPTPVVLPDEADVPILMYHYVSELPPDADVYRRDLTVSPEAFEAQLQYLDDAGYHPITLTDLYLHLTEGYPLPEKPVILTFDDGYRDAYEVVFPRLLDHGFPATFFVLATPAHYESEAYMTWAQMEEMSKAGMAIEAHGRDHVDLRGRSYDYLVYQILGIREAIEHHTGRVPRFFCYPSGRWDASVIEVLESAGYWGAVTTEWGRTHTRDHLFEMPRMRIHGGESLESFIAKLEG
jgi:peptidoglycan/xylan/chitin deacetylase (PgdA/CDA1 family)